MNILIKYLFVIVLITGSQGLYSQKYSNEFLSIGVGAEAQALGNSVVASIDDVYASYWNPSALMFIEDEIGIQLGAMHSEWFAGVGKFDYLGIILPSHTNKRRIGVSLTRFGVDNIPNTINLYTPEGNLNYDNIFEFSAADYAILGSYAQWLEIKKGKLAVGGNVKVIRRVIGEFADAWGFGLDLSANYRINNWNFGFVGRDITSTFNSWTTNFTDEEKDILVSNGNNLPQTSSTEITKPSILIGAARQFDFGKFSFNSEINITTTFDGKRNTLVSSDPISIDPSIGLNLGFNQFVFVRAGLNQFQYEKSFDEEENLTIRPSIGIGLVLKRFHIDYAFTDLGDSQNTFSHVVSLTLGLKKMN